MNTKDVIIADYRKWLLYSFDNQDFNNYYNLCKALQAGDNFADIKIHHSDIQGVRTYHISLDQVKEDLQITEEQRQAFIKYLLTNYFQTDEIDEIHKEKTQQSEKSVNHNYLASKGSQFTEDKEVYSVPPHPKESTYFNIKLVISLLVYLTLFGVIVYGVSTNLAALLSLIFVI